MADPTTPLVPFDAHVAGIRRASDVVAGVLSGTSWDARVPTCPDWDALDLLAHLAMVQRWATAVITGDASTASDPDAITAAGRAADDPIAWLREGAQALMVALDEAPEDLDALVFLQEAPPPRLFWARRQCHEATIHAADALAAAGLPVLPAELALTPMLAADGIDELLRGFWQRGRTSLRSADPYAVVVACDDVPQSWLVEVSAQGTTARRMTSQETPDAPHDAAARHGVCGPAGDLFLALWNRGGQISDPTDILSRWHEAAIRW